ncbi:hypothetical protein FDK32_27770, partial [Citrobacter freundii]|uniref:hypothetical protein n=1 Tax=Citrobacter freundii TaxID=546 RepID=UPI001BAB908E
MSVSDDIWQDIQFGSLEPFCRDGCFPSPQTFSRVFWEQYVAGGNWIGPYISIHFLSLNPLLVRRRR